MLTAAQCRNAICPPDKKRKRMSMPCQWFPGFAYQAQFVSQQC